MCSFGVEWFGFVRGVVINYSQRTSLRKKGGAENTVRDRNIISHRALDFRVEVYSNTSFLSIIIVLVFVVIITSIFSITKHTRTNKKPLAYKYDV